MEQGEKKIGKTKFKAAGFVQGNEVGVCLRRRVNQSSEREKRGGE